MAHVIQGFRRRGFGLSLGLAVALTFQPGAANALEPEHEMKRLMLATEEAVSAENWGEAGEYLNRLQVMDREKPEDYFFYRGRVMQQAGHYNEAQAALENYVSRVGEKGDHYREALQLITDIEKARRETASLQGKAEPQEKVAIIEPSGRQVLDDLRNLYLVDSDREALTIHLNSLLDMAGWREDQRIVRMEAAADVSYDVDTQDGTLVIQEAKRESDGRLVRNTQSMPVYGVNPQISWECQAATSTCWIYDPRDSSRLLRLAHDRERAEDVAETLGRLIKTMQNPG